MLLDVMLHFDAIYRMGHDVSIHWHYRPEDEDMQRQEKFMHQNLISRYMYLKMKRWIDNKIDKLIVIVKTSRSRLSFGRSSAAFVSNA